ncbi:winged helix-turn-helix transcriptional regulator [Hymenobacter daeguensis]
MTSIKEASTRNQNNGISESNCPITYVMNKIGGHWKPIILYYLTVSPKRYSEIKRAIPAITEKMLVQHLKQLQADELILRTVEQVMPPVTVYSLTPAGKALEPVLLGMAAWAMQVSNQFENLREADTHH